LTRPVAGLRRSLGSADLALVAFGAFLTVALAVQSSRTGEALTLGGLAALLLFLTVVAGTIAAPHLTVAATIPLFALIPALKLFVVPWIGPLKDLVVVAMAAAVPLLVVQRRAEGRAFRGDPWVLGAVGLLLLLYGINLGAGFRAGAYDAAWLQGLRLTAEPLLLLVVGLTVPDARRTLRWAIGSLLATTVFVALVGLAQQALGQAGLRALGYEYDIHIRTIGPFLRSFGTLDDSFAYAGFLLFGLAALAFAARPRPLTVAAGAILLAGLAVSFVRTAVGILVALLGLWLARRSHVQVAALLVGAVAAAGIVLLLTSSEATSARAVHGNTPVFFTINGRTDAWAVALGPPSEWPFGRGVGEVGTAAERGTYGVFRTEQEALDAQFEAVDSGYFATVADVGIVGLVVLLALFARMLALARRAIDRGRSEGWLAAGLIAVMLLDAVTRASFTGFPTAFLGLLLVGIALAAAEEEDEAA
jgi:O-antigen ligase